MGLSLRRGTVAALWLAGAALGLFALSAPARAAHPNALWRVVHDACVPDRRLTHLSFPCVEVDLKRGYAVVPDPRAARHLLLVPTRHLVGIESDALLEPTAPNYWDMAWGARRHLFARTGALPREDVGLAVNSVYGRSQEQLHIHLDCITRSARDALATLAPKLGAGWTPLKLDGHEWRALALPGEGLGDRDPFKLLADGVPGAREHMERQTLVLVGAMLAGATPGFVLLVRTADPDVGDMGHGEALLDKTCAVAG